MEKKFFEITETENGMFIVNPAFPTLRKIKIVDAYCGTPFPKETATAIANLCEKIYDRFVANYMQIVTSANNFNNGEAVLVFFRTILDERYAKVFASQQAVFNHLLDNTDFILSTEILTSGLTPNIVKML